MPGLKHIRGILYEDAYEAAEEATPAAGSSGHKKSHQAASSSSKKSLAKKDSSSVEEKEQQLNDEADNFPMDCQVWTPTQFFSVSCFVKNSLICLEGKSMTPHRGNTILFRSSQQLPRLRLGPLKGFLS